MGSRSINMRAEYDLARVNEAWGRSRWETNRRGGVSTSCDGWGVVICKSATQRGFYITISRNVVGRTVRGKKIYPTIEEAKDGCLVAVQWAIGNMEQSVHELY